VVCPPSGSSCNSYCASCVSTGGTCTRNATSCRCIHQ
jgi:hypothetical protein